MDFSLDKTIKAWLHDCQQIIDNNRSYQISSKDGDKDLVTDVDKKIEAYLTEQIKKNFPGDHVYGEEAAYRRPDQDLSKKRLWVLDPIDGTSNFVRQARDYCTLIAFFEAGQPIFAYIYDYHEKELISAFKGLGVYANELYLKGPKDKGIEESIISLSGRSVRDPEFYSKIASQAGSIRIVGASGLDGTRVAKGQFGAYINFSASAWDFAPFILIAEELGLHISKPNGDPLDLAENSGYMISTKRIYQEIKDIL